MLHSLSVLDLYDFCLLFCLFSVCFDCLVVIVTGLRVLICLCFVVRCCCYLFVLCVVFYVVICFVLVVLF